MAMEWLLGEKQKGGGLYEARLLPTNFKPRCYSCGIESCYVNSHMKLPCGPAGRRSRGSIGDCSDLAVELAGWLAGWLSTRQFRCGRVASLFICGEKTNALCVTTFETCRHKRNFQGQFQKSSQFVSTCSF